MGDRGLRHVSRRLEQALLAAGERVIRVAPSRTGASRKGERQPGKSDEIDALAIARAVVKDGIDHFPAAYLDDRAMEIRILFDHREQLVRQRTRTQNRLRWQLLELCPELEGSLKRGALTRRQVQDRIDHKLRSLPRRVRVQVARAQLAQIRTLTRQVDGLQADLSGLIGAYRPDLLAEQGCGTLTAAIMIGHTAGAERFRSDATATNDPITPQTSPTQPRRLILSPSAALGERPTTHCTPRFASKRALTTPSPQPRKPANSESHLT